MGKKIIYIAFYLSIYLTHSAQINLVPNPSFEDTVGTNCWQQMGLSSLVTKNWYSSSNFGSPDYFNICANFSSGNPPPVESSVPTNCKGYQQPKTGNAYAGCGIYVVYTPTDSVNIETEPFSVKLKDTLKKNHCYYAEFYVSLANISDIAINQVSMYLTNSTFTTVILSYTNTIQPQIQWDTTQYFTDTLNWVKISGTFIAQGGEQYLTISNFKDGAHLKKTFMNSWIYPTNCTIATNPHVSYIYVDDVSLYELPTPRLLSNSYIICPTSDSLVLGDTARIQTRYQWYANGNAIDTTSFIKVKPSASYTYVLKSTNCTTTTQTIVVTYSNNCEPIVVVEPTIPNIFTPNADGINDVWEFNLQKNCTLSGVEVYNRWGIEIKNVTLNTNNYILWDGRTTSGEACSDGIYFYTLQYTDANGDTHKKNGYVSLIR